MYVETSAVLSHKSCAAAFEVAALTYLGQISREPFSETNTSNEVLESAEHVSKRHSFNKKLNGCTLNCFNPLPCYPSAPLTFSSRRVSLSSASLTSKSSMFSSTTSDSSDISLSTYHPPSVTGRWRRQGAGQRMVTIQCQRLNSDKEMEEVDIEIPSDIFININKSDDIKVNLGESKGIFERMKSLF